jgi:hypothetical protein
MLDPVYVNDRMHAVLGTNAIHDPFLFVVAIIAMALALEVIINGRVAKGTQLTSDRRALPHPPGADIVSIFDEFTASEQLQHRHAANSYLSPT